MLIMKLIKFAYALHMPTIICGSPLTDSFFSVGVVGGVLDFRLYKLYPGIMTAGTIVVAKDIQVISTTYIRKDIAISLENVHIIAQEPRTKKPSEEMSQDSTSHPTFLFPNPEVNEHDFFASVLAAANDVLLTKPLSGETFLMPEIPSLYSLFFKSFFNSWLHSSLFCLFQTCCGIRKNIVFIVLV